MAPIGVAIIGGGIFVKEEHLPAVLASPTLTLKAIYSRSLKSAEDSTQLLPAGHGPVDLYSDESGEGKSYQDLLKRSDVVGIIIALPITKQPEFIRAALTAGKHVLSEKPIAKDIATAQELIEFYNKVSPNSKATWGIAENFRFTPHHEYAAEQVRKLGKVTGFIVRLAWMVDAEENKWIKTEWRKKPEYQGGFLLDAGVHFTAALRKMLGKDHAVESLVAHSTLVQEHLPPVDTVNAVMKTKSGAVGSFLFSVGTTMSAGDFIIAGEKGQVLTSFGKVTTTYGYGKDARTEEEEFPRTSGVKEEVQAWAEALKQSKPNPAQAPSQALADLELMEKMLTSGDEAGASQKLQFQGYI